VKLWFQWALSSRENETPSAQRRQRACNRLHRRSPKGHSQIAACEPGRKRECGVGCEGIPAVLSMNMHLSGMSADRGKADLMRGALITAGFDPKETLVCVSCLSLARQACCPAASKINRVISSGREISERWLAFTSIVLAPIRLAMKRSRSGLMVRSSVETA
jgi:hypothetical protein